MGMVDLSVQYDKKLILIMEMMKYYQSANVLSTSKQIEKEFINCLKNIIYRYYSHK
jgi:hypothetical protein